MALKQVICEANSDMSWSQPLEQLAERRTGTPFLEATINLGKFLLKRMFLWQRSVVLAFIPYVLSRGIS